MFFLSLLSAIAIATKCALASPLSIPHNVHERRDSLPIGWHHVEALDRGAMIPLKIGLAQNNLERGGKWLNEVSHPNSPKYGKHWTAKQVAEAFAPRLVCTAIILLGIYG